MIIDQPQTVQIPQLRILWKEAFGDTDDYLDLFFSAAFSPDRCRCITENGQVIAALYWFDCLWENKSIAYIYAVATAKTYQGRGLCRSLMENTQILLQRSGYDGCILVPQAPGLFALYQKLGYQVCSYIQEFSCVAAGMPLPLKELTVTQYAAARKALLPPASVLQEGAALTLLAGYARFYSGSNFVLAAYPREDNLMVCEFLGDLQAAPQILAALGFAHGIFRTPGQQRPFAMYRSLTENIAAPLYFGHALD